MKSFFPLILTGLAGMAAGAAIFFWMRMPATVVAPQPSETPAASEPETPTKEGAPALAAQYPVVASDSVTDKESNSQEGPASIEGALKELFNKNLLNLDNVIQRIVVTVDNATGPTQTPAEHLPVVPIESKFVADGVIGDMTISPKNYRRYDSYVATLNTVDAKKLVAVYVHFYPLFQTAYSELGTGKYFNDRLVEVIDHILSTPEVSDSPKLARPDPRYKYKFADDDLETLSSSQKVLIRMGKANAAIVKAKLRQLRGLLVHLGKKK